MGNCGSFDSPQDETAKVVVHDGTMKEFSYPVKVSYLLQLYPACFICDADEMGFNDVLTALNDDDVLIPGQLYFALPLTRLKRHFPAEELAALAVKASYALTNSCSCGEKRGIRRKQIVFFSGEGKNKPSGRVAPENGFGGGVTVDRSSRGRRKGKGDRGKFTAVLGSIPE